MTGFSRHFALVFIIMKIEDRDFGFKNLKKNIEQIGSKSVEVGIFGSDASKIVNRETGITMARLAYIHEYGTSYIAKHDLVFTLVNRSGEQKTIIIPKGHKVTIPPRSFLRSAFADNTGKITQKVDRMLDEIIISGNSSITPLLDNLGEFLKGLVIKRIATGQFKPLNELQIWFKQSEKPLVDTGDLVRSIKYRIGKK